MLEEWGNNLWEAIFITKKENELYITHLLRRFTLIKSPWKYKNNQNMEMQDLINQKKAMQRL